MPVSDECWSRMLSHEQQAGGLSRSCWKTRHGHGGAAAQVRKKMKRVG
jgi:hypothetical protein